MRNSDQFCSQDQKGELRSNDKSGNGLSPVFGGLSVKEWSDLILTFFGRECLPKSRPGLFTDHEESQLGL